MDLEWSGMFWKSVAVDDHSQGRHGNEEPTGERRKVDQLKDLSSRQHDDHQRILQTSGELNLQELFTEIFGEPKSILLWHCYENPLLKPLFFKVYSALDVTVPEKARLALVFFCEYGSWRR